MTVDCVLISSCGWVRACLCFRNDFYVHMYLCVKVLRACGWEWRWWRAPVGVLVHTWPQLWSQAGSLAHLLLKLFLPRSTLRFFTVAPFARGPWLGRISKFYFFPFGGNSSSSAARTDRIGMAVGGWGGVGGGKRNGSHQSANNLWAKELPLAYENNTRDFVSDAINLTQARRALLNNRYLIFQLVQFWRDCVRPLRTCAPKTFLQLSRRQIKILDKDLFEIINIVLLHCVCRCKNTNKRRALLLERSPSGVQHCRNPEVFFVASDRTFSNHPTCKFMKL